MWMIIQTVFWSVIVIAVAMAIPLLLVVFTAVGTVIIVFYFVYAGLVDLKEFNESKEKPPE